MKMMKSEQSFEPLADVLEKALDRWLDYFQNEQMFDSPTSEIMDFPIWAAAHFGVCQEAAKAFFYANA